MKDIVLILLPLGLVALFVIGLVLYFKFFKRPVLPCVYLITGAPKTGKSNLSVTLAVKTYKKNLRFYYYKLWFYYALYYISGKKIIFVFTLEKPMLYSNMPLATVRYNEFTLDLLLRKKRFPYKSVILLDEVSMIADSMLFKDKKINDALTSFVQLIGHETKSGTLICNTQDLSNCHYAFKRCTGTYMYLYASRHIPFFNIYYGVELLNCESNQGGVNNVINGDIQKNMYRMIFSSKYFKMYDNHYLSTLTDSLPIEVDYTKPILNKRKDSLKASSIVTLRDTDFTARSEEVEVIVS